MGDDFIETYDGILSPEFCQHIMAKFETSHAKEPGLSGQGFDLAIKDSTDAYFTLESEWKQEYQQVIGLTRLGMVQYVRKYPHLLTGAVKMTLPDPNTGKEMPITTEVLPLLSDNTLAHLIVSLYRPGVINLQKYTQCQGGYHHFHSEVSPRLNDHGHETLHRVLFFMYYLNDVAEGGETEFYYQKRKFKPTMGQLLIAPSGFTHTHKGHVPLSSDKYILTSWILFQRAEKIYAR